MAPIKLLKSILNVNFIKIKNIDFYCKSITKKKDAITASFSHDFTLRCSSNASPDGSALRTACVPSA